MTKVITLKGEEFKGPEKPVDETLADLKEFVAKVESGEYQNCQWIIIYTRENPDDTSGVLTQSLDNNLQLCEAVYMLSGAIHNIHDAALS